MSKWAQKRIITGLINLINMQFGIHLKRHYEAGEKLPFYLPFGKADDTASPEPVRLRRVVKGSR
jgi:hypothetical protein